MIQAVIFDCFGVLVGQGFDMTWRRAGGDPRTDRQFIEDLLAATNSGFISIDEMVTQACDKLSITPERWAAVVAETEQPDQQLLDYIRDVLKPHFKVAILSNANKGTLERIFTQEQRDVFDTLVVSAEVGHVKPSAEIYELTADRLGVEPSDCVFIDDIQGYCDGAAAVGMASILFRDIEQLKHDLDHVLNHT